MKKDVFVLIGQNGIIGDNVKNAHVFQAVYDTVAKKYDSVDDESCCGKMARVRKTTAQNLGEWPDAITVLAETQRDGKAEICGQCVATFYSND